MVHFVNDQAHKQYDGYGNSERCIGCIGQWSGLSCQDAAVTILIVTGAQDAALLQLGSWEGTLVWQLYTILPLEKFSFTKL